MAHHDYSEWKVCWERIVGLASSSTVAEAGSALIDITSTSEGVAVPFSMYDSATVDKVVCRLLAGTQADSFQCRVVNVDSNGLPDTTSLVHANADNTASNVGGSTADITFDFTDFAITAGQYWIVFTGSSSGGFDLNLAYVPDHSHVSLAPWDNTRAVNWDGADWDNTASLLGIRCQLVTTAGNIMSPAMTWPLGGAVTILDTAENPDSLGNRFVAPYTGNIIGFRMSAPAFSANTSFKCILADSALAAAITEGEYHEKAHYAASGAYTLFFDGPGAVTAATSYSLYLTHGATAGASTGVTIAPIDISADNGLSETYGIVSGDLISFSAHDPASNGDGGSGSPTTDADTIYGLVPIYGSITTGGVTQHSWST